MALECNLSNSFLNREQRMVVHVASLLLTDDRGLDMRELAKSFGIPANDIERIYDCALVIYDIAGNQGETLVKLPESAVDRCMEMAALRMQLGKMVAKLFPGKPQIRLYPDTLSSSPSVERRASSVDPIFPAPGVRRPSLDPVDNQSYNFWSSMCFMARLSSVVSGAAVLIGIFRAMLGKLTWSTVGVFALILCCSRIALFFFSVFVEREKGTPK